MGTYITQRKKANIEKTRNELFTNKEGIMIQELLMENILQKNSIHMALDTHF